MICMDYLQTFFYFDDLASVSFFPILWMSLFVALFSFFIVWPITEYALKRFHFSKEKLPNHNTVCKCVECHDIKLISFVIALFAGITAPSVFIDYFHSNSFIRKVDVIDSPYYQSLPIKYQDEMKAFLLAEDPETRKFEKFVRANDLNREIRSINSRVRIERFDDNQSDDEVMQYIKNAK